MAAPAAPLPGRRVSIGGAVVLAGFLLTPPPLPLYVLAPFGLLLLVSRPRTVRELFWLVATGVGIGLFMQQGGGFGDQLIRASAVGFAVAFLLFSLRSRGPVFPRALAAVLLTALALSLWVWSRGTGWPEVHHAFTTMVQDRYRAVLALAQDDPKSKADLQNLIQPLLESAPDLARVMPALLGLAALAGASLAWSWYHRIAASPLGLPPAPFRRFRFNDQLVWGAIFTLALLLAPLPDELTVVALNLLVLLVGSYAMRGLAVASTVLAPAPVPLRILAGGSAFLLMPLALGVCLALGLSDTWLDIRGRLPPPATGGVSQ